MSGVGQHLRREVRGDELRREPRQGGRDSGGRGASRARACRGRHPARPRPQAAGAVHRHDPEEGGGRCRDNVRGLQRAHHRGSGDDDDTQPGRGLPLLRGHGEHAAPQPRGPDAQDQVRWLQRLSGEREGLGEGHGWVRDGRGDSQEAPEGDAGHRDNRVHPRAWAGCVRKGSLTPTHGRTGTRTR